MQHFSYEPWPALDYEAFKSTSYLLHRGVQVIGKLKLITPFEPHWANVALWLTSRGLTTGIIPYKSAAFSVDIDLIEHHITCHTSWGQSEQFILTSMSVADLTEKIFSILRKVQIDLSINLMPQEVPNPILFTQDIEEQSYNKDLANAWWRILLSTYRVMKRYHSHFNGETPPIGLMWGTFDLRDARYNGIAVPTTGINAGYIRRNAMDEGQIEIGWWHGNKDYPKPAYFSFTYPQPEKIELAKIQPSYARWDDKIKVFILDYDDLRKSSNLEQDLLTFFESTYQAGAKLANWNKNLITSGEPV